MLLCLLLPDRAKNAALLLCSLVFYAFGEPVYLLLLLCTGIMTWLAGLRMAGAAIDLLRDPALLPQAREAFEADLDGETYRCPIPDGCEPRPLV